MSRKRNARLARPEANSESGAARTETLDLAAQRWSRLLTKAEKDPESVLGDPRCAKPAFVERFFDLCDGKSLEAPSTAPDYVEVAQRLARKVGDPHLLNLAQGVAVHALIANTAWQKAGEALASYRATALACCPRCGSDWLRRQADLLTESRDPVQAKAFLDASAEVLGPALDDDRQGRILFIRGIAHFYSGDRERALAAVDDALQLLDLSTPRGYFMDSLAFVGCFLQGSTELELYETAAELLNRFRDRLKGLKGWGEERDRLRWVSAQVECVLGHPRRARVALERARYNHFKHSPHRYALAIAIDEALIYCRRLPQAHRRPIQRILKSCLKNLKLEKELRQRLKSALQTISKNPQRIQEVLIGLRRSFIVPVPGLLASADWTPVRARVERWKDQATRGVEAASSLEELIPGAVGAG